MTWWNATANAVEEGLRHSGVVVIDGPNLCDDVATFQHLADAICGPLPFGKGTEFDGFTKCLSAHAQPFDRCLADDAHPTWLKRCDRDTPCRDDYLCVKVPGGAPSDPSEGACLPPYFLFQVRVDGHFVERD